MFNNLRLAYITTKDKEEARRIGKTLVEERLTACVNIIEGMESIYRWEEEIHRETECILIVKTTYHRMTELTERVKQLHSYDCPCIISLQLAEQEGHEAYQQWLIEETQQEEIHYELESPQQ
jgi:periplasmic divalent cation tolerance protein